LFCLFVLFLLVFLVVVVRIIVILVRLVKRPDRRVTVRPRLDRPRRRSRPCTRSRARRPSSTLVAVRRWSEQIRRRIDRGMLSTMMFRQREFATEPVTISGGEHPTKPAASSQSTRPHHTSIHTDGRRNSRSPTTIHHTSVRSTPGMYPPMSSQARTIAKRLFAQSTAVWSVAGAARSAERGGGALTKRLPEVTHSRREGNKEREERGEELGGNATHWIRMCTVFADFWINVFPHPSQSHSNGLLS
jgi:hypothetical protein